MKNVRHDPAPRYNADIWRTLFDENTPQNPSPVLPSKRFFFGDTAKTDLFVEHPDGVSAPARPSSSEAASQIIMRRSIGTQTRRSGMPREAGLAELAPSLGGWRNTASTKSPGRASTVADASTATDCSFPVPYPVVKPDTPLELATLLNPLPEGFSPYSLNSSWDDMCQRDLFSVVGAPYGFSDTVYRTKFGEPVEFCKFEPVLHVWTAKSGGPAPAWEAGERGNARATVLMKLRKMQHMKVGRGALVEVIGVVPEVIWER